MNDGARYLARIAARRRDRLSGEEEPVRRNRAPQEWRAVGSVPGARCDREGWSPAADCFLCGQTGARTSPQSVGGRMFRFRLASFRFGKDLTTRRFSVTEPPSCSSWLT